MGRRTFLGLIFLVAPAARLMASGNQSVSLRGKLKQEPGKEPYLLLPDGRRVTVGGDKDTNGVLNDARLKDTDFEVIGHFVSASRFEVDPIYKRALFVDKGGKRLYVTYWCDVCYIRTYTPGNCWCCQKYTALDLRETDDEA